MLGVRRSTSVSRRHPGVLSTPTMRIPRPVFMALAGAEPSNGFTECAGKPAVKIGCEGSFALPESFLVESLMSRKLGVADSLVNGRLTGCASVNAIASEEVPDPLGTEMSELTAMVTISVVLAKGADEFPPTTTSYSRIIWAPTGLIAEAVDSHDALLLNDTLDPFEVCIDGLCMKSAARITRRRQPGVY